jgi:hypothetical protein
MSRRALPQNFTDQNELVASDKNPTEGEVGEVQRASRHDLVRALAPRCGHVGKHEKNQILDQVCEVTGYTRQYALTLLMDPPGESPVKRTRHRSPSYGPAEVELLRLCWLVTDGICSKCLAPFLPELLDRLRRRQALREFPAFPADADAGPGALGDIGVCVGEAVHLEVLGFDRGEHVATPVCEVVARPRGRCRAGARIQMTR